VVLSRSVIVSIRMPLIVRRVLSSEMERMGEDLPEVENLRPIIRISCFSCMLQSGSQDGRSSFDDDGQKLVQERVRRSLETRRP
jgi:hypothetical protein